MTENGLDIQTITTKRTDFKADHVLLLGQVTEKKGKAFPSHFLKFLLADTHLALPDTQADLSQNQKSAIYPTHSVNSTSNISCTNAIL